MTDNAAAGTPTDSEAPVVEEPSTSTSPEAAAPSTPAPPATPPAAQSSLAAPRGLSYAVDIVFCIDVTGSMTPIIDAVKANAIGF